MLFATTCSPDHTTTPPAPARQNLQKDLEKLHNGLYMEIGEVLVDEIAHTEEKRADSIF